MSDNTSDRYAVVVLSRTRYALPVSVILDLNRFTGVPKASIPGSPGRVECVVNHRGRVVPVLDLRALCGLPSHAAEIEALETLLRDREQDHVNWLNALAEAVETGGEFTLARDPHLCKLGKWYDELMARDEKRHELTDQNLALEAILHEYDQPHARIHALADHVLDLCKAGDQARALAAINMAWDGDLAVMRRLFGRTLELFREIRQSQLVVMDVDGVVAGLMVDAILAVAEFTPEMMHPLPIGTKTKAPVIGLADPKDGGGIVSLLDPAAVLSAVGSPAELTASPA